LYLSTTTEDLSRLWYTFLSIRKVLRNQRGSNGYSEAVIGQTDNTMAKKGQKDKQWSTKHYTEN
jgi:hypothetical protein